MELRTGICVFASACMMDIVGGCTVLMAYVTSARVL